MFVAHATQYFQLFNAAHLPDDVIANFLKGDEQLRANLINAFNYSLVPECHLDWVFESDRQSSWIGVALSQPGRFQNLRIVPQYLVGRAKNIALLDYGLSSTGISNDERVAFCKSLRNGWELNTRLDRYFSWLDDDDEGCYSFLWDWTRSRTPLVMGQSPFLNRDGLLGFFDEMVLPDLEKVLMIQKAQRAWNQRRQREKMKGRKQCNFVLSDRVIHKLEKLSEKHRLSRTEIVELIIDSEARSEFHISKYLNRKSLLTSPLPDNSI